jgi:hypothetical protein
MPTLYGGGCDSAEEGGEATAKATTEILDCVQNDERGGRQVQRQKQGKCKSRGKGKCKAKAEAEAKAEAKANTGILRCAQNDKQNGWMTPMKDDRLAGMAGRNGRWEWPIGMAGGNGRWEWLGEKAGRKYE